MKKRARSLLRGGSSTMDGGRTLAHPRGHVTVDFARMARYHAMYTRPHRELAIVPTPARIGVIPRRRLLLSTTHPPLVVTPAPRSGGRHGEGAACQPSTS